MTDLLSTLSIPEEIRSYLAVLGLLLCWKLHGIEARRKKAVISQFYICLSRNDPATCDRCRMAHMHVCHGRSVSAFTARIASAAAVRSSRLRGSGPSRSGCGAR